jgi:hypothetical protein
MKIVLFLIWKIPGSILGPEAGHLVRTFMFSSVSLCKMWYRHGNREWADRVIRPESASCTIWIVREAAQLTTKAEVDRELDRNFPVGDTHIKVAVKFRCGPSSVQFSAAQGKEWLVSQCLASQCSIPMNQRVGESVFSQCSWAGKTNGGNVADFLSVKFGYSVWEQPVSSQCRAVELH